MKAQQPTKPIIPAVDKILLKSVEFHTNLTINNVFCKAVSTEQFTEIELLNQTIILKNKTNTYYIPFSNVLLAIKL